MIEEISRQEEFVLRTLEERGIRFVRLWFTDVLGYLKSVAIAPAELDNAFAEGIGFDGGRGWGAQHDVAGEGGNATRGNYGDWQVT